MLAFIVLFLIFASFAFGSPLIMRDIWNPPITSPNEKTVWNVGDKATVTWNVSNMPPVGQLTRSTGTVLLGFLTLEGENLMIDSPLATGFNLTDAQVQITVPSVPTRSDYIVVVLGDSGNASPQFTIQGVGFASTFSTSPIPITGTTITQPSTSSIQTSSPGTTITQPSTSSTLTSSPSLTVSSTPTSTALVTSGYTSSTGSTPAIPSSTGSPRTSTSSAAKKCVNPALAYSLGAAVLALLAVV